LFNSQIYISTNHLSFSIKYAESNELSTEENIKKLIDLPGLDFYKCYYDGVKLHCTTEAIQCHKTGNVKYTGKINMPFFVADKLFRCCYLKFENKFWNESNKEYVHTYIGSEYYDFNYEGIRSEYTDITFSDEYNTVQNTTQNIIQKKIHPKHMFVISSNKFKKTEHNVYNFIKEIVFENPIISLS
jgi:hypothetical protein